jgi:NAD(P)-dependent dehydrogenase (short-subunit alcohol dehydrogenase family)
LVLGGSAGLGFAYAEHYAQRGDNLIIVARDSARIEEARRTLLRRGARSVEMRSSDLADAGARAELLDRLARTPPFSTIFVGGPGPPAGRADEVSDKDHARARRVCIDYPSDIFDRAAELIEAGGRFVLLSSSAADEPLEGHRFYLSALYRRQLDRLVLEARERSGVGRAEVIVLKPTVVLTPLSERFALRTRPGQPPRQTLSQYFNVGQVRTAAEYISDVLIAFEGQEIQCLGRGA